MRLNRPRTLPMAALLLFALASMARADQVIFKNGDKLTGTIVSVDAGKMKFTSKIAGDITIDMNDVETFSSDGPIKIYLNDGTVLNQKVASTQPGAVAITPGQSVQPQQVQIADVKAINPNYDQWTGDITSGGLLTRGNSDTESFSLSIDLTKRGEKDRTIFDGTYLFGNQKNITTGVKSTTVDNWMISGEYDYFLTPKWYLYGNTTVAKDRIAFLNLRLTPGGGIGYQWVETPKLNFNTEAGIAWFYEDYATGGTNQQAAGRLAYHLKWQINDKVSVFHDMEYDQKFDNSDDFFATGDAGIHADLSKTWFTEFKFQWTHDSRPAPAVPDDLQYTMSIGLHL